MKFLLIILFATSLIFLYMKSDSYASSRPWKIQSIDTMKQSRDLAREKLKDTSYDKNIDMQIKLIAETGATHVAIGTPYDDEFIPYMKRWVKAARKYNLNVWFRGNFSGWEEWFEYDAITPREHTRMIRDFIRENSDLFENGDIFSTCPECENGNPGDPRNTGGVTAYRRFLIAEYQTAQREFERINKSVAANYFSMNGDVARLIMDKDTTDALDGIVVVDHYVNTPQQLVRDIDDLAKQSGGTVILGEFGAPIPDIHGTMTEDEQSMWIKEAMQLLSASKNVSGMNYWTSTDGTTEIWNEEGKPRKAVEILKRFYTGTVIRGTIVNEVGERVGGVTVIAGDKRVRVDNTGRFSLPYIPNVKTVTVESSTYENKQVPLNDSYDTITIALVKKEEGFWFQTHKFFNWLKNLFFVEIMLPW